VKTIIDPLLAVEPAGSHLFRVQSGQALVTENFKPIRVVRSSNWRRGLRHLAARLPYLPFDPYATRHPWPRQISVSELRINHYVTRSAEEVAFKYKDRNSMRDRDRLTHARYHDRNEVEDPILVSQAELVRQIISRIRIRSADVRVHVSEWALDARRGHAFDPVRTAAPITIAQPGLVKRIKTSAFRIRRDLLALCLAARDRRVPWYAKALAGIVGAYPIWPIDLIPDVVPVLGYLDDLIIVPLGIFLATRLIPATVMADLRAAADRRWR
jgi:uncharacterized membrane protein YkvA (DUF1232 family)